MSVSPDVADHQPRILIVDDERHNRQLLEVMLAPELFDVRSAATGEEALAMVAEDPPDLILLDIMMPGMDGYEVAARIKGNPANRSIPIIMVTALDDRSARMHGLSAGAEAFLSKPVDHAELSVRVRNLLRLKAIGDYHDKYGRMLEGEVGSRAAELVESERLYRATFEAAPVGIVNIGLNGRWLRVNQRLCDLLGYSREALEGETGRALMQSDGIPAEAEALRALAAGRLECHVIDEKRFQRGDGSFMWARVKMSVHRATDGEPQHFISVIEDITERRTLEGQVRQSSKMDAIGRLAAGVAHDFNNLLTVITGFTELLIGDGGTSARQRKNLDEISKAARRATALTGQLLAFSRQQVLNPAPLDVNALITDMARMLNRLIGDDTHVALALAPNLSLALADRGQLEQVVMNLVVNARDAMPDGGSVTIETRNVDLENSAFHTETIVPGSYVMLAVTDTGKGMTREVQRRLFEPFFTTKQTGKGTGLGLSTTYGIVKQSRGYIWVYSEQGQGTTFKVYLPRSTQEGVPTTGPMSLLPASGSETVLLVEDEESVREVAKHILDNAGYLVIEAVDGNEAERRFGTHDGVIDLVVADVIMPGCGGPELLKRLHVRAPALRVLYMSGYTEQSLARRAGIARGTPLVQKPFTAVELLRKVREVLDGKPQASGDLRAAAAGLSPGTRRSDDL